MLRRGYVELIAVIDPSLNQNFLPHFLSRFEGMHILAFGCPDADAALADLRRAGFGIPGVSPLARPLPPPFEGRTVKFRLLRFGPDEMPEGRVIAIQHETAALMRQTGPLDHPNGAESLEGATVAVADLAEAVKRYTRFLGPPRATNRKQATFVLQSGTFVLVTPDALAVRLPGIAIPSLPFPAEVAVGVSDLSRTRGVLAKLGAETLEQGGGLLVPGRIAGGTWCRFVPAST
jgi:catechol 2,3-dioxygenase-like lactoylglutathione lyase family enzyme